MPRRAVLEDALRRRLAEQLKELIGKVLLQPSASLLLLLTILKVGGAWQHSAHAPTDGDDFLRAGAALDAAARAAAAGGRRAQRRDPLPSGQHPTGATADTARRAAI